MADNTIHYVFSGTAISYSGQTISYSGDFTLDYTTYQASGYLSEGNNNFTSLGTFHRAPPNGSGYTYVTGGYPVFNGAAQSSNMPGIDIFVPDPNQSQTLSINIYDNGIQYQDVQPMACFVAGTRIRTARGDVPVEALVVGDLAVTASGEHRPIRWIGHRTLDPRRHPHPEEAMPVRIRANALGHNRPAGDLVVSPGHAIALEVLDSVLIPASSLVNGATIVQEEVESVTYWHVELDSHDLLQAENQAAESYLDMGNRGFFAERGGGALGAGPDADPAGRSHADFCRPFYASGPLVEAVRLRVRERAGSLGWRLVSADPWAGVHLLADGVRVEPEPRGLTARFRAPAGARDLWLVSHAATPRELEISPDPRQLGLQLAELRIGDGWDARAVALNSLLLCVGFHPVEDEEGVLRRWTTGRARLPAALWAGKDRTLVLRLAEAMPAMPRWCGPAAACVADEVALDTLAA